MDSCIYLGQVKHSRRQPVLHRFRYGLFYMYVDLDELDDVFERRWFWSTKRAALARFRRRDHLGDPAVPLVDSVRELVEKESGSRPDGAIRLLTHFSYFGFCFNPVSFYYCYDADGELHTIVAEVSNTPWGEMKTYVLPIASSVSSGKIARFKPRKKMHVSPFMPMSINYDWCFNEPGEKLSVYMANYKDDEKIFDASIAMTRREISGASLASVLLRFPFMTAKVVFAIYWEALRLWIKRTPFYTHPKKQHDVAVQE